MLLYDPANLFLGRKPHFKRNENICLHKTCIWIFTTAPKWKQPKCSSTDEGINKIWYSNTIKQFLEIKRNQEYWHVLKHDGPQKHYAMKVNNHQRLRYYPIPFVWNVHIYRKSASGLVAIRAWEWYEEGRKPQGEGIGGIERLPRVSLEW